MQSSRWLDHGAIKTENDLIARIESAPANCRMYIARIVWWDCEGLVKFSMKRIDTMMHIFSRRADNHAHTKLELCMAIVRTFGLPKRTVWKRLKEYKPSPECRQLNQEAA